MWFNRTQQPPKLKNAEYIVLEEVLAILESGRIYAAVERIKIALELLK